MKISRSRFVKLFSDRKIWVRQVAVTAIAAATAWQAGDQLLPKGGLVAAIVCTLSIRVSLHRSVREGFGQVIGTAIGAGVALITSHFFHFGFLAVGITVVLCSVVARALHLGEIASINVPVTALIVIGPGLSESRAVHRLISTLIGAVIAMCFSYFTHPKTPAARALDYITSIGKRSSELLLNMSRGVSAGYSQEDAASWLAQARLLVEEIPFIRSQALEAKGFAKWFPTAEADVAEEIYSRGVAIEHTIVQVRTIARTLFDSAVDGGIPQETKSHIAEALSTASFAITAKIEMMDSSDDAFVDNLISEEVREAGANLAESLIESAENTDQEQLVRSISLVTNIDRIADSLDQSSPALTEVEPPIEPPGLIDMNTKTWRNKVPKWLRKYL